MRKFILPIFTVVILLSLVSCGGGVQAVYFDNAEYVPNIAEIETIEETSEEAEALTTQDACGFMVILNAYAEFVRSDFTEVDLELIGHSYLVRWAYSGCHSDWVDSVPPTIVYAFRDINGDGVPELLIGNLTPWDEVFIRVIYSMQSGTPAPFISDEMRGGIGVWMDIYGDYIISAGTTRMGTVEYNVFLLDESGKLRKLDSVSMSEVWDTAEGNPNVFRYTRFVDNEIIPITVDDFYDFFTRFGIRTDVGRVEFEWTHFLPTQ